MNEKDKDIHVLNLENDTFKILENNNIYILNDLCIKSKTELKKLNLTQKEIDKIEIELQLRGLNLKNNL